MRRFNNNNNDYSQERRRFNHYEVVGHYVLERGAFTREQNQLPKLFGGGIKAFVVTSHTQLSRLVALGHYTSWNTHCCRGSPSSLDRRCFEFIVSPVKVVGCRGGSRYVEGDSLTFGELIFDDSLPSK